MLIEWWREEWMNEMEWNSLNELLNEGVSEWVRERMREWMNWINWMNWMNAHWCPLPSDRLTSRRAPPFFTINKNEQVDLLGKSQPTNTSSFVQRNVVVKTSRHRTSLTGGFLGECPGCHLIHSLSRDQNIHRKSTKPPTMRPLCVGVVPPAEKGRQRVKILHITLHNMINLYTSARACKGLVRFAGSRSPWSQKRVVKEVPQCESFGIRCRTVHLSYQ